MSTVNNISELNNLSLSTLNSLTPAFLVWNVAGCVNFLSASTIVLTIINWKPLHNKAQILLANLAFSDAMLSLSHIGQASYHLFYIFNELPETTSRLECHIKLGHMWLFDVITGLFHVTLSIDRFLATTFPIYYLKRKNTRLILTVVYTAGSVPYFLIYYFTWNGNGYIPVCIIRATLTEYQNSIIWNFIFSLSVVSIAISSVTIVVLRVKVNSVKNSSGNIVELKEKMQTKVTKTLTVNIFLHLATVTVASFGGSIAGRFGFNGTTTGPYFRCFFALGGIVSLTVYYCCHDEFRKGIRCLFRKAGRV